MEPGDPGGSANEPAITYWPDTVAPGYEPLCFLLPQCPKRQVLLLPSEPSAECCRQRAALQADTGLRAKAIDAFPRALFPSTFRCGRADPREESAHRALCAHPEAPPLLRVPLGSKRPAPRLQVKRSF
ncbi:hypothetical protein Celaphus_00007413 [Cervus elaphus hippelaphus]|uniref:Uncharacterized protein n=1 Tax=Cervus elaphus hippelaphus TaxID=46360 RepID=A0A212CC81_CEREH|nr:hypothetical protein Celaphus_00007413 [Cervus elaphus hippelaphus]